MTASSGLKVLLLDDERDFCELLQAELSLYHIEVLVSHTLADALAILETEGPSSVLLDYRLKEAGGTAVDFLEKLRNVEYQDAQIQRQIRSLPVFVLTGEVIQVREAVERYQVAEIIQKPFAGDRLAKKILRAASQSGHKVIS